LTQRREAVESSRSLVPVIRNICADRKILKVTAAATIMALVALAAVDQATAQTSTFESQPLRTWTNGDASYSLDAKLIAYDSDTKTVTLEVRNGDAISVPINQLSRRDQRIVKTAGRIRQKSAGDKPRIPVEKQGSVREHNPAINKSKNLFGIQWTDSKRVFGGDPKLDASDRPIMWLRVLGDLDGFM
jgi:hypothetical protein